MASIPRYTYIISRNLDPLFAIFIGLSAAATRINREEKEKGRSRQDTMEVLQRRVDVAFGKGVVKPGRSVDRAGEGVE
ncbi:hypothetical protein B9Z65_2405 [Elsinoe australis]|uniref:Non-classical export protein 1 n=1 Tax=Elsinoe australis TaxID=40998 RepID=A0A2P7ZAP3_9PEZI|nr:hypothetical protein B9Z65_2405 [Elsinoe australis]